MTIGIGAICSATEGQDGALIVCASDRMITSDDVEFEPTSTKIYQLTTSIVMLTAGDTAAQSGIYYGSRIDIQNRLQRDASWMSVHEAANIVSAQTVNFARQRAERTVLEPYGLSIDSFITHQGGFQLGFLADLRARIERCRPGVSMLIAGIDLTGAHIYNVNSFGRTDCNDAAGFGAIGIGRRHAESQFMFARHSAWKPYPETFLLTYTAKKRAEVAPGVGADTDMCGVYGLGGYFPIRRELLDSLETLNREALQQRERAAAEANVQITGIFRDLMQSASTQSEGQGEQAIEPA